MLPKTAASPVPIWSIMELSHRISAVCLSSSPWTVLQHFLRISQRITEEPLSPLRKKLFLSLDSFHQRAKSGSIYVSFNTTQPPNPFSMVSETVSKIIARFSTSHLPNHPELCIFLSPSVVVMSDAVSTSQTDRASGSATSFSVMDHHFLQSLHAP